MTARTFTFSVTSGTPAWANAISVGSWGTASSNTFSGVSPGTDLPIRPTSGMFAYSGGVFASDYSTHGGLLVNGGGHNDYYGNEVMAFNCATGLVERCGTTYPTDGSGGRANYADGEQNPSGSGARPATCHTLSCLQYVPGSAAGNTKGLLLRPNAYALADPIGDAHTGRAHAFNLDTNLWARFYNAISPLASSDYAGATAYDTDNNVMWWFPKGNYAPRKLTMAGVWSTSSVTAFTTDWTAAAVYVPTVQKVFVFSNPTAATWPVSIVTPATNALQTVTPSGGPGVQASFIGGIGVAWCADLAKILVYPYQISGVGNRGTIYTFDPVTLAWATLVTSASAVTAPYGGVWGRFQYAPPLKCAIVAPTAGSNVMAYKVA